MPRTFLIFALCLPLAVLMGFMLSDPLMSRNMLFVAGVLGVLLTPLMIAGHHTALIWVAGTFISAYFVKGRPEMWMIMAVLSFLISVISRPLARNKVKPVWTRSLGGALIFLSIVVLVTANFTGGIGLKALGSSVFGGRKYLYLASAICGFFALTFLTVPRKHAQRDVALYCLGPITASISNLAYMLGPAFYFLYLLFPVEFALNQAYSEAGSFIGAVKRFSGLGVSAIGIASFMLVRYGLRGILNPQKPLRVICFAMVVFLGMLSGFRSAVIIICLTCVFHFFAEGLHRTRYAIGFVAAVILAIGFLSSFSTSLPLAAQRAISFLPIEVDPRAEADAAGSLQWRLDMWRVVAADIPKYFWLGKGYALDPADLYFAEESTKRGLVLPHEAFIKAGDYHNGPLSLIIPFGIFGVLGFVWFCFAAVSALWKNLKYGDAELRNINTFLFSFFGARLVFFLSFFGAFEVDLWLFCSIVGLSLSVNGGVREKPEMPRLQFESKPSRERAVELVTA